VAKALKAGREAGIRISDNDALRWMTANPAWALGLDDRIGTLEPGKDADVVIWDHSPFSVYARAEKVFIDGALMYDRLDPAYQPVSDFELGILPAGGR
jgi:imidazolonepropionase-like amidohydrolase